MRGRRALAALLLGLVVSGVSAAPGRISQQTLPGGGQHFTLSVPAKTSAAPLVVSLHYGGPVSPWYGRGLLEGVVEPALRDLNAVMVAPDCAAGAWADCADAVADVVAHVRDEYDASCTVIVGYSKGGIGTWDLAGDERLRARAAVVMAARPPDAAALSRWTLPVRVLHGERDELFPLAEVEAAVSQLHTAAVDAALEVLPGASHYETHRFTAPLSRLGDWIRQRCDVE